MRDLTLVRSRPWADIWRVEAGDGRWWLKVNRAATTYEPRLLAYLNGLGLALLPDCRVHPEQPWSLIEDAGTTLTERNPAQDRTAEIDLWCTVMADHAVLQQTVAARGFPGSGLPDFSPERLVQCFDEVLNDTRWFTAEHSGLTRGGLGRIAAVRPALESAARRLAGAVPCSVQHDDLHGGNVVVDPTSTGPPYDAQVIDWGDAVWAHPFGTLLVTLRSLGATWGVPADDPVLRRVQDAYLEPWRRGGESYADLVEQLDLALRTGGLLRAAGWIRALGTPQTAEEMGFADAPGFWMMTLAESLEAPGTSR